MPGMVVCERNCLSPSKAADAIKQYPNLKYAILMPWVEGLSWFDVLSLRKNGQSILDKAGSLRLAANLAAVLSRLEALGIAHCDLSAGNIMLDPDPKNLQVELIDVEDLFAPGFQQPSYPPLGTPGYQHRTSNQGQWHNKADRFAAAVLLAEMLGWYDNTVRTISYGETYFEPSELQSSGCQRFDVLRKAISAHDKDLPKMLECAWKSTALDECPSLKEWNQTLSRIKFGGETISASDTKSPPLWESIQHDPPNIDWKQPAPRLGDSVQWELPNGGGSPVTWDQTSAQVTSQNAATEPVK